MHPPQNILSLDFSLKNMCSKDILVKTQESVSF